MVEMMDGSAALRRRGRIVATVKVNANGINNPMISAMCMVVSWRLARATGVPRRDPPKCPAQTSDSLHSSTGSVGKLDAGLNRELTKPSPRRWTRPETRGRDAACRLL
jgi:hypothetical protein